LQQRRLPGTLRTDESEYLSRAQVEIDSVDGKPGGG
jgi:hypothetical protein